MSHTISTEHGVILPYLTNDLLYSAQKMPFPQRRYQVFLKSNRGPIDIYLVSRHKLSQDDGTLEPPTLSCGNDAELSCDVIDNGPACLMTSSDGDAMGNDASHSVHGKHHLNGVSGNNDALLDPDSFLNLEHISDLYSGI